MGNYTSWNEAINKAKQLIGSNDWDKVVNTAKDLMSKEVSYTARHNHLNYLNSLNWKEKRERILKRDNYICQDCLKVDFEDVLKSFEGFWIKDLNLSTPASEVHHTDYSYLYTPLEENYCISLCSDCHKIRHWEKFTISAQKQIKKERENKLSRRIVRLLKANEIYKIAYQYSHQCFLKSITINPNEFVKRLKEGTKWQTRLIIK